MPAGERAVERERIRERVRRADGGRSGAGARLARRGFSRLPQARSQLIRRPDRPSRLFSGGIGDAPAMDRRSRVRRPCRSLPVPAGAGVQPGRLRPRGAAQRRPGRRARCVDGFHHAFGADPAGFRTGRFGIRRPGRAGLGARPQTGGGGGRRAGAVGHGAQPRAGSPTRRDRARRAGDRRHARRIVRADRGDRPWRARRPRALSRRRRIDRRHIALSGQPGQGRRRALPVRRAADGPAAAAGRLAGTRSVRRLLSLRRLGLRRRPRRAAVAAG